LRQLINNTLYNVDAVSNENYNYISGIEGGEEILAQNFEFQKDLGEKALKKFSKIEEEHEKQQEKLKASDTLAHNQLNKNHNECQNKPKYHDLSLDDIGNELHMGANLTNKTTGNSDTPNTATVEENGLRRFLNLTIFCR